MADEEKQKSIDSLLEKRQTLDGKRKGIENFRTAMLVLSVAS